MIEVDGPRWRPRTADDDDDRWWWPRPTMMDFDIDDRCRWSTLMMIATGDGGWRRRVLMMSNDDDTNWCRRRNIYKMMTNTTLLRVNFFLFTANSNSRKPETNSSVLVSTNTHQRPIPNCSTHWLSGGLSLYTAGAAVWRSYIYLGGQRKPLTIWLLNRSNPKSGVRICLKPIKLTYLQVW